MKSAFLRTGKSLLFSIPKPSASYDASLQPLYDSVQAKFSNGSQLNWPQFYPVAKSYLARNLSHSLVSTYQNKYTLHRSITLAAVCLYWLVVLTAVAGWLGSLTPHWMMLASLQIASIALILCFSSSYSYHWKLFGNTIVTECYSLIYGPDHAEPKP